MQFDELFHWPKNVVEMRSGQCYNVDMDESTD